MNHLIPLEIWLHPLQESLGFRGYAARVVSVSLLAVVLLCVALRLAFPKSMSFIFKNLRRNLLRTVLAGLAVMVLALVVTLVWSILVPLDVMMTEKTSDFKLIVTDRWKVPSQMPFSYVNTLEQGGYSGKEGQLRLHREDSMTWSFYFGTVNPKQTAFSFDDFVFCFALDPHNLIEQEVKENGQVKKVPPMMDQLEHTDAAFHAAVQEMLKDKTAIILGRERLARLNKRVGDRIRVYAAGTLKTIDLDFKVVGVFPDLPSYNNSGAMNRQYLEDAIDAYPGTHNGTKHELAGKSLSMVWLRVADASNFGRLGNQIMSSPLYADPAVKAETAASGMSNWLESWKDIFFGVKWFLVPTLLLVMCLVMGMAISINVRERRQEMAVLKVLGFTPGRILAIVLGEAVFIGALSGYLLVALVYAAVQCTMGGIPFPIVWMAIWPIPTDALWWGPLFGGVTSLLGSLIPAWSARNIKVAEVFAKVA
ncbi:MAG TPA: ABC transporter permease [Gemmataceae bacterium]|nr:ABC transporter permease [Gemmataceae bacterium]